MPKAHIRIASNQETPIFVSNRMSGVHHYSSSFLTRPYFTDCPRRLWSVFSCAYATSYAPQSRSAHKLQTIYLIGQKFGGQKIRRTKIFGGQNFRHLAKFSALLSAEFVSKKSLQNILIDLIFVFTMVF